MSVISLIAEREKRTKPREDVYYCLKCDGADFRLLATGAIRCVNCGSTMSNLRTEIDAPSR